MMDIILYLYHRCQQVIVGQIPISKLSALGLFDKLVKMKYDIPNDKLEMFNAYRSEIDEKISALMSN